MKIVVVVVVIVVAWMLIVETKNQDVKPKAVTKAQLLQYNL